MDLEIQINIFGGFYDCQVTISQPNKETTGRCEWVYEIETFTTEDSEGNEINLYPLVNLPHFEDTNTFDLIDEQIERELGL